MNITFKNSNLPKKFINPFICYLAPFVCLKNTLTQPLICVNIPYVRNKGFTLIEAIITLTIVGILLALAGPAMSGIIQNHRLSGQVNDFIGDLNIARSEAIKRGSNITICKQDAAQTSPTCNTNSNASWTAGWVIFIDTNSDGQVTAGETVLRVRQALAGNGNAMTSAATDVTGGIYNNAATLVIYISSGLTTIKPGVTAQFQFCDSRGAKSVRTAQLISTGRATVSTAAVASCQTSSNW